MTCLNRFNTLSTYIKNKDYILRSQLDSAREPGNPNIDGCELKRFLQARDKIIHVSGIILRARAEHFIQELGKGVFKSSTGW